jgi:putative ABC transport system substrate-binding protein
LGGIADCPLCFELRTQVALRDILPNIAVEVMPVKGVQVTIGIGRRQFISALSVAAVSWPITARSQQPGKLSAIGMLQIGSPDSYSLSAFRQGLKEVGYIEGQNLMIEYRWADNDRTRLPELARDLVGHRVSVIVTIASALPVSAVRAVSDTIPVVFGYGGDPVEQGIVASLNRPGGNVTGMTSMSSELVGKQLGILRDLLRQAAHFGFLISPNNVSQKTILENAQAAASASGCTIEVLIASSSAEINDVLVRLASDKRVEGLLVSNDPLFIAERDRLIEAATRDRIPMIFPFREQAEAGGLMSYGPDLEARDREVAHYVGRILNGEKPVDLPVLRSTKFEFIINLKTAKALGLKFPSGLLSIADEVIE